MEHGIKLIFKEVYTATTITACITMGTVTTIIITTIAIVTTTTTADTTAAASAAAEQARGVGG
jgi:hypothetical protein